MMKRVWICLIAIALAFSLALPLSLPVSAASARAGNNAVSVSVMRYGLTAVITLISNRPLNNGTIEFTYPAELTCLGAESEIASDGVNDVNTQERGKITVSWATLSSDTKGEIILKVTLTGSPGAYEAVAAGPVVDSTTLVETEKIRIPFVLSGDLETPPPVTDNGHTCYLTGFHDVNLGAWYHEALDYVVGKGYFNGVATNALAPESELSRAMVVTVLYRVADVRDSYPASNFADVGSESWYASAVAWGQAEGIVNGYENNKFGPDDLITRQDMVTILYRFAESRFGKQDALGSLSTFADGAEVSDYAADGVKWAVYNGIVGGYSEDGVRTFRPGNTATRAEFAQVVYLMATAFLEN